MKSTSNYHKMKSIAIALLACMIAGLAPAAEIRNLLANPDFSTGMDHWEVVGDIGTAVPEAGGLALDVRKCGNSGLFKLQQALRNLEVGRSYRFCFDIYCEKPQTRPIVLSYRMRNKPKNLGFIKWIPVKQGLQKVFVELIPGLESDNPQADPPVLAFYLGEMDGRVVLSNLLLVDLTSLEAEKPPFSDQWALFGLVKPETAAWDAIPAELPGLDGQPVTPVAVDAPSSLHDNSIDLRLHYATLRKRHKDPGMLYNEFHSDRDRLVAIGFGADWYMDIYLNGQPVLSTMDGGNMKKPISSANHFAFLPVRKGRNLLAVKVLSGSENWVFHWGCVEPPPEPQRFTAAEGYHPINTDDLAVKAGSALDLSGIIDAPAGKYGRAVLTHDGHIAFEDNPAPQRFFGFSGGPDESVWKTAKADDFGRLAAEYARAIRAQGYNLFRMHGFDKWVMTNAREDQTPLPLYQDRWDRMVHEMKQQGIYLQLNLFAFALYAPAQNLFLTTEKRNANKVMFLIGEPSIRARFAETSFKVLNHVNPYTGLAWKDDPAFVAVEFYNELGLGIELARKMENAYPAEYRLLKEKWRGFLQEKYAGAAEGKCPHPAAVMADPPLPVYWDRSKLRADYDEFWYECMKDTYRFCDQVMKDCGYDGLTVQCPMPALRCAAVSWESLQIVDAHGYHCHPDGGEQPGASVSQVSSIADAAPVFRRRFGQHIFGRPFFFNEHNYVFRNPYQYEKPVSLDAYAALDDWDSMAIHSGAVALKNDQRASSFHAANNPVLRAGEFLSALFFLRRDVAPARHNIAVALDKSYVFAPGNGANALAPTQSRLGLLTRVSSLFTDLPPYSRVPVPEARPDMVIAPAGSSEIVWHGWYADAKDTVASDSSLESVVGEMRRRGILAPDNITDLSRQIYQSETGQITMYATEKKMTVITPKSEAAALPEGKTATLGMIDIRRNTVNSLVALASVDDLPLTQSRRMVLVLSTRIANTNMQHDPTGVHLRVVGTLPILYQCGKYDLAIRRSQKLRCYALSLSGERMEEVPLAMENGIQILKLDMAALKHGPTPFFEMTADTENP